MGTPRNNTKHVIRWVQKSVKAICSTSQLTIDPLHTVPLKKNYINIICGPFKQLLCFKPFIWRYEEVSIRNNSIFVNFSIMVYDRCNRQATVNLRARKLYNIMYTFDSSSCAYTLPFILYAYSYPWPSAQNVGRTRK